MENKMKSLVEKLNAAAEAYYNGTPFMTDFEYDQLYSELEQLEAEAGYALPNSPTQVAGATVVNKLPKAYHEHKALSLAKTKDIDEFVARFKEGTKAATEISKLGACNEVVLMFKLDGSTVVATYDNGKLTSLVTRGNGEVGSVITHNAPKIKGLPMTIDYKGHLVVRGEAVMSYKEFNRINSELDVGLQFKNPRNLATASIAMLDSSELDNREIWFNAFELVSKEDAEYDKYNRDEYRLFIKGQPDYFWDGLTWLDEHGFNVVERALVTVQTLKSVMMMWGDRAKTAEFPVDGLVAAMNDAWYTKDLVGTNHNPNIMKGFAFKWADAEKDTVLREIEWSASRTGLLNPVAVFDPVELEGTTVSRASIHNVSYIIDKDLKIGDNISVFKANMIIPQIADNKDAEDVDAGSVDLYSRYGIPRICPVCGGKATVVTQMAYASKTKVLFCQNPDCAAKKIGAFEHFCERDCMNIVGMSGTTIEKLVDAGIIKCYSDFFRLKSHPEIASMEGFGERSLQKMIDAAETARKNYSFVGLIHAMGIPNVGKGQAKLLKKAVEDWSYEFYPGFEMSYLDCLARMGDRFDFESVDGFGSVIASSLTEWIDKNMVKGTEFTELSLLLPTLWIPTKEEKASSEGSKIAGKTFVITGSLNHFKNRDEMKEKIESLGGKVSGSVSAKTDYLVNNDVNSTSSKNKKAKELGVKIISEDDFMALID